MTSATILIVDDTPTNLDLLSAVLQRKGYAVRPVISGEMALKVLEKTTPDLILLDVMMPEMNGYEVAERLKADERFADTPIIFLSALDDAQAKVKALHAGGVDYITKPFNNDEVLARIGTHLELHQRRLEVEQLREADRQSFDRLSKMKDDIMGMASHDLKNPLSIIMTSIYLLEEMVDMGDEDVAYFVTRIQKSADRMRTLIHDLLDIARIETGLGLNIEPVAWDGFVKEHVQAFLPTAQEKSQTLNLTQSYRGGNVMIDPSRIAQVLDNLISNAIKYTPEGGAINVQCEAQGENLHIMVSDTGLGIPKEALGRLFDAFYRVETPEHRDEDGTGLGLSIVKSIVEQHHGVILVESTLGKGTQFEVVLPLNLEEESA